MPDNDVLHLTPEHLDEKAAEPLYQQIYTLLREQITAGTLATNTMLPAEQELTEMLGVSRITVKRALNELATSGLVHRQRGRGTIVTYNAAAPTVKGSFETLIDGLKRMRVETQVKLLDVSLSKPSADIREALELSDTEKVQRIVRLRKLEGEPFSYLVTHIPEHVAEGYDDADLASQSLIALLAQAGHAPRAAQQTITASAAEPAVAAMLGIAIGSPLLRIHRIMRDESGKPVQDITAHYRADRFQYQMNLSRASDEHWISSE